MHQRALPGKGREHIAALRDALLLFPVEDEDKDTMRIYAVQVKESGALRWVHWELSSMWSFGAGVSLDEMLTVLTMTGRSV